MRPFFVILVVSAAAAAIGSTTACAKHPGVFAQLPQSIADTTTNDDSLTTLEVENRSTLDVRIFIRHAGQFVRLGQMGGIRKATFRIPSQLLDQTLIFYADPIGSSRKLSSDPLVIRRGDRVQFMLDINLNSFAIAVF